MPIGKIISGGQTGVDRAALDFAIARGLEHGGWCPAGRRAADGMLPACYRLTETESTGYRQRTKRNVQASDATLILYRGELEGGSLLTRDFAVRLGRPHFLWRLDEPVEEQEQAFRHWLATTDLIVLNVAGPSEARCPGIYRQALAFLDGHWNRACEPI